MSVPPATRHYSAQSATASAASWAASERHQTTHGNHARRLARAWRRQHRIHARAFLPGRWEPGYWTKEV